MMVSGRRRRLLVQRGDLLRQGRQRPVDTDRHRRHAALPGVPRQQLIHDGTRMTYRAVVRDNAGHPRISDNERATVPKPRLTIEAPVEDATVFGTIEVRRNR